MVEVMVGSPDAREAFVSAARDVGATVMFSASAFARRWTQQDHDADLPHPGFSLPPAGRLRGVRFAVDSAGFTAAKRFGDYVWTPAQYASLVRGLVDAAAEPDLTDGVVTTKTPAGGATGLVFASAMDLCQESEVAADRQERLARIMRTAHLYDECRDAFRDRGLPDPMPVIQGYDAWDYEICISAMEGSIDWSRTSLVGIGSVCRRHLHGNDGLYAIVDKLDRLLPKHVRFHLFGVKSAAMACLASHERIASADSMAWNTACRADHRTGRNNEIQARYMTDFYARQVQAAAKPEAWPEIAHNFSQRPRPVGEGLDDEHRADLASALHRLRNGDLDLQGWHHARFCLEIRAEQRAEERAAAAKATAAAEARKARLASRRYLAEIQGSLPLAA